MSQTIDGASCVYCMRSRNPKQKHPLKHLLNKRKPAVWVYTFLRQALLHILSYGKYGVSWDGMEWRDRLDHYIYSSFIRQKLTVNINISLNIEGTNKLKCKLINYHRRVLTRQILQS
jgi:hypothetical protein